MPAITRALLLPCLGLAACASAPAPPLHERPADLAAGEDLWCLAPDGKIASGSYASVRDPLTGRQREACTAPARFVRVPLCRDGQPWPDETPAIQAARARLARDGSLHGDSFEGKAFCIPLPPS